MKTERKEACLPFTRQVFKAAGYLLLTSSRRGRLEYAYLYRPPYPGVQWMMELWLSWAADPQEARAPGASGEPKAVSRPFRSSPGDRPI